MRSSRDGALTQKHYWSISRADRRFARSVASTTKSKAVSSVLMFAPTSRFVRATVRSPCCTRPTDSYPEGGGCIVPSPFDSPKKGSVAGVDCSSIPHVENVSCQAGACAVRSCGDGWTVNKDGTGCIAVAASLGAGADISLREVPDGIEVGAAGEAGAQDLWHTARTLSEKKKLKEDWTRILDIRSEDVAEADSGGARGAPKKIQQDWVRIPDYRRFGLE